MVYLVFLQIIDFTTGHYATIGDLDGGGLVVDAG